MERQEAKSLGDLLRQAVEESQGAFGFDEINAINAWPVVIGSGIARKTMRPYVKAGVMYIRVPAAPLRHELNMMRTALMQAINREASRDYDTPREIIKELRFVNS